MAEEPKQPGTGTGDPAQEPAKDWKAEYDKVLAQSRKWEERSKANAEKAKKYDALAAESMTDKERAEAAAKRADEAEAKLQAIEAEAQRAKDAAEVSEATGVPASLLTATDRDGMMAQAASIKAFADGRPSSQVFGADGKRAPKAKRSPEDAFAEYLQQQMS